MGKWLRRQNPEKLTKERKAKLEAIGMTWEDPWEQKFRLLRRYYREHGNLKMPADYVVDGVWLRRWLTEQIARLNEKPTGQGKRIKKLTAEQIAKLHTVGVVPERPSHSIRVYL